jgi:phosphoenolpyruvate carboxykinase (GTP)
MPGIYYVNWFRKSNDGKWLWPGFGENSRVLKWVVQRCAGKADIVETPIGNMPAPGALDVDGLDMPAEDLAELLSVDVQGWLKEIPLIEEHFAKFGDKLPAGLHDELNQLKQRLNNAE